jgi:hypothetical protein
VLARPNRLQNPSGFEVCLVDCVHHMLQYCTGRLIAVRGKNINEIVIRWCPLGWPIRICVVEFADFDHQMNVHKDLFIRTIFISFDESADELDQFLSFLRILKYTSLVPRRPGTTSRTSIFSLFAMRCSMLMYGGGGRTPRPPSFFGVLDRDLRPAFPS